jgi:hypothetical protein
VIEQLAGCPAPVVCFGHQLGRGFDQPANETLFADDARVVLDVRGRRHHVEQVREVFLPARRVELSAQPEFVGEREDVDHDAAFVECHDGAEDPPVALTKEQRVVGEFGRAQDRVAVHDHRAEHRLFGVLRPWRSAVAKCVSYRWRDRGVFEQAGHLPTWAVSSPDS